MQVRLAFATDNTNEERAHTMFSGITFKAIQSEKMIFFGFLKNFLLASGNWAEYRRAIKRIGFSAHWNHIL